MKRFVARRGRPQIEPAELAYGVGAASPRRALGRTGLINVRARGRFSQLATGVSLAAAAGLIKAFLLVVIGHDVAYLPFFACLVPAAVAGGRIGGITFVIAGALGDALLFHAPQGSPFIADATALARFVLFLPIATWIVLLLSDLEDHRRGAADAAARFEALLDGLPDAAVLLDGEGRVRYANQAMDGLGRRSTSLTGASLSDIVPGYGEAESADSVSTLALVAADGADVPVDVRTRGVTLPDGTNGSIVTLRDARPRLDDEVRLLRLARDERARTDALRTVIATLSDGVGLFDREGRLIVANDALGRLAGRPIVDRGDLPAAWLRTDGAPVASGDPVRWVRASEHRVNEEGGSTLVVATDETAAMEAAAVRDAFIGVMSHELRTPVTSVLAAAHLLSRREATLDPTSADLVRDIRAETTRLNELIEDLLVLSRAQMGAMAVDPEPVLLQHLVEEVVRSEARRYPHVGFRTDIETGLPPVSGDRTYIGQILRNLVGNAGKYTLDAGADVTVEARVERNAVRVRVLDRGPGFSPELADRLFDIYFRRTPRPRRGPGPASAYT